MIRDAGALQRFEDSVIRGRKLSHAKALQLYESMWREGVTLGALPPKDPLEGIDVDIRIAKILNLCLKKPSQR